jgi:hypothetical protein
MREPKNRARGLVRALFFNESGFENRHSDAKTKGKQLIAEDGS